MLPSAMVLDGIWKNQREVDSMNKILLLVTATVSLRANSPPERGAVPAYKRAEASRALRLLCGPQCYLNTAQQIFLLERLAQEANRASLHRAFPSTVISMARHKNDGYAMPLGN
jgi:hypothetical protein